MATDVFVQALLQSSQCEDAHQRELLSCRHYQTLENRHRHDDQHNIDEDVEGGVGEVVGKSILAALYSV